MHTRNPAWITSGNRVFQGVSEVKHDRVLSGVSQRLFGPLYAQSICYIFLMVQLKAVQYGWEEWPCTGGYSCQQDQTRSCGNLSSHSHRDDHSSGCGCWFIQHGQVGRRYGVSSSKSNFNTIHSRKLLLLIFSRVYQVICHQILWISCLLDYARVILLSIYGGNCMRRIMEDSRKLAYLYQRLLKCSVFSMPNRNGTSFVYFPLKICHWGTNGGHGGHEPKSGWDFRLHLSQCDCAVWQFAWNSWGQTNFKVCPGTRQDNR